MKNRKTSTLLSIGLSAALVAAAIWYLFDHHRDIWGAGTWHPPHGMMGFGGMGTMMALFWGVVIVAVVLLVSAAFSGRRSRQRQDALEILKIRYARGEIDKRRFDAMRRELQEEINYEC